MNDSSTSSERSYYLYILVLGNIIAVTGMTFLMLGILGALGLISAITNSLGSLGSAFDSPTNESAVLYSYAFLASLLSLAASWKMFREGRPQLWLLGLVIVLQLAAAAAFHSGVSVLVAIPLVAAIYGLVVLVLRPTPRALPIPAAANAAAPFPAAAPQAAAPVAAPVAAPAVATPVAASAAVATVAATAATIPVATPVATAPAYSQAGASALTGERGGRTCADCGAGNPPGARFCRACGSILPG